MWKHIILWLIVLIFSYGTHKFVKYVRSESDKTFSDIRNSIEIIVNNR